MATTIEQALKKIKRVWYYNMSLSLFTMILIVLFFIISMSLIVGWVLWSEIS